MLSYNSAALSSLIQMTRGSFDFLVFVEDHSYINLHENIIHRAIVGISARVKIYALGEKKNVIAEAEKDQLAPGIPCLFVVDGDLDLISRYRQKRVKNLYRLRVYCIENLLFSKENIYLGLCGLSGTLKPGEVNKCIKIDALFDDMSKYLHNLFVLYASVNYIDKTKKTVGHSFYRILRKTGNNYTLSESKWIAFVKSIIRDVRISKGITHYVKSKRRVNDIINKNNLTWRHFVSGKDYLFPIVWRRIKDENLFKGSFEHFIMHISNSPDFDFEGGYKKKLRKIAKQSIR